MNNIKNKKSNLIKFTQNAILLASLSLPAITTTKTNAVIRTPLKLHPTIVRTQNKFTFSTNDPDYPKISQVKLEKRMTIDPTGNPTGVYISHLKIKLGKPSSSLPSMNGASGLASTFESSSTTSSTTTTTPRDFVPRSVRRFESKNK